MLLEKEERNKSHETQHMVQIMIDHCEYKNFSLDFFVFILFSLFSFNLILLFLIIASSPSSNVTNFKLNKLFYDYYIDAVIEQTKFCKQH
ncbi:hypothetical protein BLOT_005879 [Blomia tropicalis]|nr:hypothetical protein BLOT_005879 [Blomia tropicalis]